MLLTYPILWFGVLDKIQLFMYISDCMLMFMFHVTVGVHYPALSLLRPVQAINYVSKILINKGRQSFPPKILMIYTIIK